MSCETCLISQINGALGNLGIMEADALAQQAATTNPDETVILGAQAAHARSAHLTIFYQYLDVLSTSCAGCSRNIYGPQYVDMTHLTPNT